MKHFKAKAVLLLALATLGGGPGAAPAPWWKWRSKIDGQLICSQTQLGPGWEKTYGPFRDARCEKLIVVR
jgi:hypothetical protein